jgi:hypothetical protein
LFLLCAETALLVLSTVTVEVVKQQTAKRFRPQGGTVAVKFGGDSDWTPFQDIADKREEERQNSFPAGVSSVPGTQSQPPKQPKKKSQSAKRFGKF